jgi:cytochrome c-type biogenesis protein CcmH
MVMETLGHYAGFAIIAVLVAIVLVRAVTRAGKSDTADLRERAMRVYRDQLSEVDRDLVRGTLQPVEADRLRLEIQRRILDLDRDTAHGNGMTPAPRAMRGVALGAVIATILGSGALYMTVGAVGYPDLPLGQRFADAAEFRANRPSQSELEERFKAAFPMPEPFEGRETLEPMVAQLRDALTRRPDDVTGHTLLAQNEARLGNFTAAIAAQTRVIDLKADQVTPADMELLMDLMVLATGGWVSPEAESLLERTLRMDPTNKIAMYYLGRMYEQTERPDMTFRVWRRLHELSAGDDPWMEEVRARLPELAMISGEPRWTLPPLPAPANARGPSAADIDAAQDMSAEERMVMIESMVDGLMARLANDGGTAQDWAQLLRALTVLDRRDQAQAILQEARTVFAARTDDLALINQMARDVGLSGSAQ